MDRLVIKRGQGIVINRIVEFCLPFHPSPGPKAPITSKYLKDTKLIWDDIVDEYNGVSKPGQNLKKAWKMFKKVSKELEDVAEFLRSIEGGDIPSFKI